MFKKGYRTFKVEGFLRKNCHSSTVVRYNCRNTIQAGATAGIPSRHNPDKSLEQEAPIMRWCMTINQAKLAQFMLSRLSTGQHRPRSAVQPLCTRVHLKFQPATDATPNSQGNSRAPTSLLPQQRQPCPIHYNKYHCNNVKSRFPVPDRARVKCHRQKCLKGRHLSAHPSQLIVLYMSHQLCSCQKLGIATG